MIHEQPATRTISELFSEMIKRKLLHQVELSDLERSFLHDGADSLTFGDMMQAIKDEDARREVAREEARLVYSVDKSTKHRHPETVLDFDDFVIRESADTMAERMQADTFVLGRLAIMGQSTVFYGGPNVGKTLIVLKLLTEALRRD